MTDPVKYLQEALVICVCLVLLGVIIKYWDRVVFFLTGDDRIHVNCLDCLWATFFQACGLCRWEWTRCLTRWPCCPRRFRGKNLMVICGRICGFASHTVELRNIVVGDIPYNSRGDFYLAVECQANPPMVTALQEKKLPKVVHFPEVITLRIRDNALESRVRIYVKELHVFGSRELCDIHLDATSLVDWSSDDKEMVKRFKMRCLDNSAERETPPWITLEVGEPEDIREIDSLPNATTAGLFVRTSIPVGADPQGMQIHNSISMTGRKHKDDSIRDFKQAYHLVDDAGNVVAEPSEDDLWLIATLRKCVQCMVCLCTTVIFFGVTAYCIFRFYVWSCYRQFRWMTMAYMNEATFPISKADLRSIVNACKEQVKGTGMADGVPCRPSPEQIEAICVSEPGGQRPAAFVMLVYNYLGINLNHGVPCFHGICKFRAHLVENDKSIIMICVVLVASTFVFRCLCNQCIKCYRRALQRKAAKVHNNKGGGNA